MNDTPFSPMSGMFSPARSVELASLDRMIERYFQGKLAWDCVHYWLSGHGIHILQGNVGYEVSEEGSKPNMQFATLPEAVAYALSIIDRHLPSQELGGRNVRDPGIG